MGKTRNQIAKYMSIEELKQRLSEIIKNKSKFKIAGYKSSGSGAVYDFELEYGGPGLYKDLIEQSLDAVKTKPEVLVAPEDCDKQQWDEAINEQIQSFEVFLAKSPEEEKSNRSSSYTFTSEGYAVSNKDNTVLALHNCKLIKRSMVEVVADTAAKETKKKGDKTRFKEIFKSRLPINNYVPMLTLSEDKCEAIQLL